MLLDWAMTKCCRSWRTKLVARIRRKWKKNWCFWSRSGHKIVWSSICKCLKRSMIMCAIACCSWSLDSWVAFCTWRFHFSKLSSNLIYFPLSLQRLVSNKSYIIIVFILKYQMRQCKLGKTLSHPTTIIIIHSALLFYAFSHQNAIDLDCLNCK